MDIIEIDFKKSEVGLGFNIVGGSDVPHLAIDCGIFVTKILPDGPAARDGRLQNGDKIISINGVSLEKVTHSEAVSIFRNSGSSVKLRVQQGAERLLKAKLDESNLKMATKEDSTKDTGKDKENKTKNVVSKSPVMKTASAKIPSPKISPKTARSVKSPTVKSPPMTKSPLNPSLPANPSPPSKNPTSIENPRPPAQNQNSKENPPKTLKQETSANKPVPKGNNFQSECNSINMSADSHERERPTIRQASEEKKDEPLWQQLTTLSVVIGLLGLGVAMYLIVQKVKRQS